MCVLAGAHSWERPITLMEVQVRSRPQPVHDSKPSIGPAVQRRP
jgi:hypothetical protein